MQMVFSLANIINYDKRLQQMQQTLAQLQSISGDSVIPELQSQLEESRTILSQMKNQNAPASEIVQTILSVILSLSDHSDATSSNSTLDDEDTFLLSDNDITDLACALEQIPGVQQHVRNDALRQVMTDQGRSLRALVEVARHAVTNEIPVERNIFTFPRTDTTNTGSTVSSSTQ
jgi:hypothetical protein